MDKLFAYVEGRGLINLLLCLGFQKAHDKSRLESSAKYVTDARALERQGTSDTAVKKQKKTLEELFDDEMLRSTGRDDQIVDKVLHAGRDADGRPCCVVWALSQCDDFANQRNAVEEYITSRGHKCIFLPKFHPEFNFIERFWAFVKWYLRKYCQYTMTGLWENLEKVFSEAVIELALIRKFARTSWRWMDAYRHKWSLELTTFATKVYHGHRQVPPTMDSLVMQLREHKRKAAAAKLERLVEEESVKVSSCEVGGLVVDPHKLVGLWIEKEFEGFGKFRGQVKRYEKDLLGRDMFNIRYLDGDTEDLFLSELLKYTDVGDVVVHVNR